jgi:hypothetical protein
MSSPQTVSISKETLQAIANCRRDSPVFDLKGHTAVGLGVDVHDGDTCKVVFPNPDNSAVFYKWTIRMMGYDAPELKGETKEAAIVVRDLLKSKVLDRPVYVECLGLDKYGRLLANLYEIDQTTGKVAATESINAFILRETANVGTYAYFGGTKQT